MTKLACQSHTPRHYSEYEKMLYVTLDRLVRGFIRILYNETFECIMPYNETCV